MTASSDPDLLARARDWLAADPDPQTREELAGLVTAAVEGNAAAVADLVDRFDGRLQFGTAGLRGAMGAGPNRMNRVLVIRAAAGLAAYLLRHGKRSVIVGYDARHRSETFATDTCSVLTGAGLRASLLPRPLPTPVLAFAIRHLGADAGVMVTASHNPAADNGYKVYLGDGVQIVPPADAEIAAAIDAVGLLATVPRPDIGWTRLDGDVVAAYLVRAAGVLHARSPRDLRVAYTPLHGVGGEVAVEAFRRAGFPAPLIVEAQAEPDADFPTVPLPNPEEPGVIDRAIALAKEHAADLVLANDPDADRCAAAAPFADGWRMLSGDEVGGLLAAHLLGREPKREGVFACSIVSSSLLGRIAAAHDAPYAQTLTGFKWIARVPGLRFGYEEALGYCVDPAAVRDKDGITAALLLAELAATLKAAGRSLEDALDDLAREFGVHLTDSLSIRAGDVRRIRDTMRALRAAPPPTLGGRAVDRIDDLAAGLDGLPPTEAIRYALAGDARVIVRPSGTEPKLKCYLEVVEPVTGALDGARARARQTLAAITADLRVVLGADSKAWTGA